MNAPLKSNLFLLGIGGIGMSALAKFLSLKGHKLYGYDRNTSSITQSLVDIGISVITEENLSLLEPEFLNNETTDIIYTPAIPANSLLKTHFEENGFRLLKRSEVLEMATQNYITLAVAGTHGKTTTSAVLCYLLSVLGHNPNAFLGGIAKNFNNNFVAGNGPYCVVEADEFDRSFLRLHPYAAIITAMDPDHLDIYQNKDDFEKTFLQFSKQVSHHLLVKNGLPISNAKTYGWGEGDYQILNLTVAHNRYQFIWKGPGFSQEVVMHYPGRHNVENAIAAASLLHMLKLDEKELAGALAQFEGVKRRFEIQIPNANTVYVDDYAHHPEELKALLNSVRELYPEHKLTLVFQPHLFSRTRDFMAEFGRALALSDELFLLPIYPAREIPIPDITSERLLETVPMKNKQCLSSEDFLKKLETYSPQLLISAGAGDIDQLVEPILKKLSHVE